MRGRSRLRAFAALVLTAAFAAGCASTTDGAGSADAPTSLPAVSSAAPPSASPPAASSLPASAPATTVGAGTGPSCDPGVDFCDAFDDPSSGWPVQSTKRYFADYSTDLGGTYRMGERTATAKTETAPYDVTTVSSGYGTHVEVDAVLGPQAPLTSYLGVGCWGHVLDSDHQAGFLFFVTARTVDVTLLDDTDGGLHTIAQNTGGGFVQPYPAVNHLAATCELGRNDKGVRQAELTLEIDGNTVLHTTYERSVTNHAWAPGPQTSLLVAGPKSVVFYDNVAISGR